MNPHHSFLVRATALIVGLEQRTAADAAVFALAFPLPRPTPEQIERARRAKRAARWNRARRLAR